MAISLNSHAAGSTRESLKVLRVILDTSPVTRTLPGGRESLNKSMTKIRENVQQAHSSNKDEEQGSSKTKKTLAFDTSIRRTENIATTELAKIQALELAVEELRKGKTPAKRSSLPG